MAGPLLRNSGRNYRYLARVDLLRADRYRKYSRSRSLCCRPSVCLSVTLVHPTQEVVIFCNISMAFGT